MLPNENYDQQTHRRLKYKEEAALNRRHALQLSGAYCRIHSCIQYILLRYLFLDR